MDNSSNVIRALCFQVYPWLKLIKVNDHNEVTEASGPMFKLFYEISRRLNKKYIIIKNGLPFFGVRTVSGNWTGMIGELTRNKADIIISPTAASFERSSVVTFSNSVYFTRLSIIGCSSPPIPTNVAGLVMVFDWEIWLLLWLAALLMIYISSLHIKLEEGQLKFYLLRKRELLNVIFDYISVFLFEASSKEPGSEKNRILLGTWWLSILVLMNAFCGLFRANMMIFKEPENIETLRQLANHVDEFHPYICKGTAYEQYFKSGESPEYKKIWKAIEKHDGAKTWGEFFSVENILGLQERKYVLISEVELIKYSIGRACNRLGSSRLYIGHESFYPHLVVYAFRKGYGDTEFILNFNERINWALEGHLFAKWVEDEYIDYLKCVSVTRKSTPQPLGLDDLGGIFILVLVLQALSFLAFLFELFV